MGAYSSSNTSSYNSMSVKILLAGTQHKFIKPSVLSNFGMLRKKYKWVSSGQYPNVWVQDAPGSTTQSDKYSQGMYIHTKKAANMCVVDVNNQAAHAGAPTSCECVYVKHLNNPLTSEQYTMMVQNKCASQTPEQKPVPAPVQTVRSCSTAATTV